MQNPNEYDDDAYLNGVNALSNTISQLWNAGASLFNIEDELAYALENATGWPVMVTLQEATP